MKAFIVTVSALCLCGLLLCFWAYATGNLPLSNTTPQLPVPVSVQQATMAEEDPLCSPCVEKMASILEMMEKEWEAETAQLASVPDSQQVEPDTEEECSPCEENLKRLKAAREQWERERNAQEAVAASNTDDSP